jgi:hypothetical protein
VTVDGRVATQAMEWPDDNPVIDLTIANTRILATRD